jgi:pilus assembly protein CpaB
MSSALRLSVISVLLLAAAALGLMAFSLSQPKPVQVTQITQEAPPPPLMVSYLVAAHALPVGTLAREDDFVTRSAPSASVPDGAMTDTPEVRTGLRGALVRRFVDAGGAVTATDVLRPRDRGFLASVLEPGTRAISINVDAETGVSGLVWPGDHVDVVLTQQNDHAEPTRRALSETFLRNVRIIAIDQEIVQGAPANTASAGKVARTVTLQVAPDQVEKVTVAGHLGKLSLAMRSAMEQPEAEPQASGTTFSADVSPAIARQAGATVQVYQGTQSREWSFRGAADAR